MKIQAQIRYRWTPSCANSAPGRLQYIDPPVRASVVTDCTLPYCMRIFRLTNGRAVEIPIGKAPPAFPPSFTRQGATRVQEPRSAYWVPKAECKLEERENWCVCGDMEEGAVNNTPKRSGGKHQIWQCCYRSPLSSKISYNKIYYLRQPHDPGTRRQKPPRVSIPPTQLNTGPINRYSRLTGAAVRQKFPHPGSYVT